MPSARIYVGNIEDAPCEAYEIEEVFRKYGEVTDVWIARRPPGFAFVSMADTRDAEDAVSKLDGSKFRGGRIRVELSRGGKGGGGGGFGGGGRGRSRSPSRQRVRSRSGSRDRRRRSPSRSRDRRRSDSRDRRRSRSR